MCNESQPVSLYSLRQSLYCLWKIPPITAVKSNVTTFIHVLRFDVHIFYFGRVDFTVFKHGDIKDARQRLTSTASHGDGYCGAPRDVTREGTRETTLASSTYVPFTWSLLTFTGWNWKCHVINVIKTDLSGFVVPMHSGLWEQYVKSPGLTPSGFDFLFRTRPRALGQQNPPEPILTP